MVDSVVRIIVLFTPLFRLSGRFGGGRQFSIPAARGAGVICVGASVAGGIISASMVGGISAAGQHQREGSCRAGYQPPADARAWPSRGLRGQPHRAASRPPTTPGSGTVRAARNRLLRGWVRAARAVSARRSRAGARPPRPLEPVSRAPVRSRGGRRRQKPVRSFSTSED